MTGDSPEDLTFPANVLADILDGENEVSVWEIDDPDGPELNYVAAALHSANAQNLHEMTFRKISDWRIKESLQLRMHQSGGGSVDSKLNKSNKHWVIEINTAGDAVKLAKALKEHEPRVFSRPDIMRLFAQSLQAKRIPTDKVSEGLWKKLLDEGYLTVVAKESKEVAMEGGPTDVPQPDAVSIASQNAGG